MFFSVSSPPPSVFIADIARFDRQMQSTRKWSGAFVSATSSRLWNDVSGDVTGVQERWPAQRQQHLHSIIADQPVNRTTAECTPRHATPTSCIDLLWQRRHRTNLTVSSIVSQLPPLSQPGARSLARKSHIPRETAPDDENTLRYRDIAFSTVFPIHTQKEQ